MSKRDDAAIANLERLAQARTEQLRASLALNAELLDVLKRIKDSLQAGEDRKLVEAVIRKAENGREKASIPAPFSGRKGLVPPVDPDDLRAVWELYRDAQARTNGEQFAIDKEILERACKPGTDVEAVAYRVMMLFMPETVNQLVPPEARREFAPVNESAFQRHAASAIRWP